MWVYCLAAGCILPGATIVAYVVSNQAAYGDVSCTVFLLNSNAPRNVCKLQPTGSLYTPFLNTNTPRPIGSYSQLVVCRHSF